MTEVFCYRKIDDKEDAIPTEAERASDNSMSGEDMGWVIPCWLCGEPIPVKFTKKNKPFLICNNCGVQTFIRYGKAEELLIAKIKQYQGGK